jgi:hypothetical protein
MKKELWTILKKRYGRFLIFICLAIIASYIYIGISNVATWKEQERMYDEIILIQKSQNKSPLSKKEGLSLFNQGTEYEEGEPTVYYTTYFNEIPHLLLAAIVLVGFSMFFVDLKTGFNEFLFSLGVSKKRIYVYKYLLIALPFLSSVLLAKILYIGIVVTGIPSEYVNISFIQLGAYLLGNMVTNFLYFSCAAFIGSVTGHILWGPFTAFSFWFSLTYFISGCMNAWYYFTGNDLATLTTSENKFLVYTVTKESVNMIALISAFLFSMGVIFLGYLLFSKLSLETKGRFLLFKQLNWPLLLVLIMYVPLTLVFGMNAIYNTDDGKSPILKLVMYAVITALIASFLIYQKNLQLWWQQKRLKRSEKVGI